MDKWFKEAHMVRVGVHDADDDDEDGDDDDDDDDDDDETWISPPLG